jgi:hypothetical protein
MAIIMGSLISVVGHADATGSDAENLDLSLHRANLVRDQLVESGVPAGIIEVAYHGANNPLVPTKRGIAEPRNRRVEITIRWKSVANCGCRAGGSTNLDARKPYPLLRRTASSVETRSTDILAPPPTDSIGMTQQR